MRLNSETAAGLSAEITRGNYDRDEQAIGIVHFGIGAFHRAHQAWYTDLALSAGERDWLICGVSLRSTAVADQLDPQDGLFTLTERSGDSASIRLVGSVREVLFAPRQSDRVVARIADPACRIVSFTVTEKGYARGEGDRLDPSRASESFYPLLARGLAARRAADLPGVTLLPCDNLADNGGVLAGLVRQWLEAEDPALREWFDRECRVPSTMVDRIVPRSGPEDLEDLEARIGLHDAGAVFTERFSQWVIEDDFAGPRPAWECHGVQMVDDVAPYETAKLRMLNGAHSLLAYCGLRAGHDFIHEAVADPELRHLAERLMRREAMPTIPATAGQDLGTYADELIARFADPTLRHRLAQIAMDGTQKIPQRWLDTARALSGTGINSRAIARGFDAWLWHLADGRFVDDPFGQELVSLMAAGGREAVIARCFEGAEGIPPLWAGYRDIAWIFRKPR
ncbi:mannitol dehydrogenase family protein [Tsuneonella sp. YG55]|uniref:Mannitol dehydrogenase family protein n=1 Tax=Tsuneonella litorea TaxID=2976475 RepID=A0A9X2W0G1_9SPHN|nr:mannitol dehydrogenase family protein [Tsuneonella litorea]MCT2558442.1 mannitol dehydrogenase family protein [Tsuneonella litorea]